MKKSQLDKEIEQEYYKQAQGRQISILDMPKLSKEVREAVAVRGESVADAMGKAVAKFTIPA